MKIVYCGNGSRGEVCLQALLAKGHEIQLVVIHPNNVLINPLYKLAELKEIPYIAPEKINDPQVVKQLGKYNPDVVILSGYSQILDEEIINLPKYGCINLHGGKLPKYRGSSPINWSIINGEAEGGISIIRVERDIDTGAILAEETFPILPTDDANTILKKTLQLFPELLINSLELLSTNSLKPIEQNVSEAVYYPLRKPKDGLILWDQMKSHEVINLVRGLVRPYPGAFSYLSSGGKIYIWKASYFDRDVRGIPGRVIFKTKHGVVVMCLDRSILLKTVQIEHQEEKDAISVLNYGDEFLTTHNMLLEAGL